jgi:hypothetical protein
MLFNQQNISGGDFNQQWDITPLGFPSTIYGQITTVVQLLSLKPF